MTVTSQPIGVAVIGGGMAGRAHAAGYRTASTLFGTDLGPLPGFDAGLHGLRVVSAVAESARSGGNTVKVV
ncbi:hypothetical protein [Mycolicibacterium sp.]|uniref:hypothetical protein n=1 Tax=Mycolicibacterium sp. TaxID=2320850 RepID=UPI0037C950B7